MAKESGITLTFGVDDSGGPTLRQIENDLQSWDISTPRGVQDVTGLDKSAIERLLLLADATATLNGTFNDAANKSHAVFKTAVSTSVIRTMTMIVSGQTFTFEAAVTDYALTRAATGELTYVATGLQADGTVPSWS